jgi:hypothetical protein
LLGFSLPTKLNSCLPQAGTSSPGSEFQVLFHTYHSTILVLFSWEETNIWRMALTWKLARKEREPPQKLVE